MQLYFLCSTNEEDRRQAEAALRRLEMRGCAAVDAVLPRVEAMVDAVRAGGDAALRRFAMEWDGLAEGEPLRVSADAMREAWDGLDAAMQEALRVAAARVRRFAERQMPREFEEVEASGLRVGQRVRALDAVGCYVPGGRYPLPSTMGMTVIPAQVAGVERIAVVSPNPAVETLGTAHLLGVTEFYRVGGAQAVAALAWGTETIAPVRKIVGPGNRWVTAAKALVARQAGCGIDMQAGPTEIVVASEVGEARAIAADLVAQAEHDPDALAVMVTTRAELAEAVMAEVSRTTNETARQAMAANGYIFVAADMAEARAVVNRLAGEHLTVDAAEDVEWVRNAGSVFVGAWSPQPMGDYVSGPNHTLPTGGQAAQRGGLSVMDFLKLMTVQEYSPRALTELGPHAARLAQAEGLRGHEAAIRERMESASERADRADDEGATRFPAPRALVLRMPEYHPPLGDRSALRLDFNENTEGASPRVVEALRGLTAEALTRYPERGPMEARVAAHLGVAADEVVLTNGVDEAIHLLCQTYLDAGDELLLPVPTYAMYEIYAAATDARVVRVEAAEDFAFPAERLMRAITPATRLIAIANPNSPTGSVATREQLLCVAEAAPQAMVLVDEAYFHFHGETVMDVIGMVPNLLVARTFSKAYGLAGLRLGALAGRGENLRWVRRVLSPYSVNAAALTALGAALEDEAYLARYVSEVLAARAEFEAALDGMGVRRWPSRANFVLVEIGSRHREFCARMREAGVLVRDRSADPGCDGLVRITVGTREQMARAARAMRAVMVELGMERMAEATR